MGKIISLLGGMFWYDSILCYSNFVAPVYGPAMLQSGANQSVPGQAMQGQPPQPQPNDGNMGGPGHVVPPQFVANQMPQQQGMHGALLHYSPSFNYYPVPEANNIMQGHGPGPLGDHGMDFSDQQSQFVQVFT